MATIINKDTPFLIKDGKTYDLKILSDEAFAGTQSYKNTIHNIIGDQNNFEFIGVGDRKIKIPIYFETQQEYEDFVAIFSDGKSFLISCSFFPIIPVNIEGNITLQSYYRGWGTVELNLTTAVNPEDDFLSLYDYQRGIKESIGSKKTALDKLKEYGQNIFDFTSNTNQTVGVLTNNVAAYAAAMNNIAQGIGSLTTIITNPISSIKSSASQVVGGISGVISSMQNAVNAINQIPNDLTQLLNSFLLIGDQLNDLFDLGDRNETLKFSTGFLSDIANSLMNIDLSSDNANISTYNSQSSSPEYFLTTLKSRNSEGIAVLTLVSILLNLYENAENINKWNTIDLEKLRATTESIYEYVNNFDISNELHLQIDLARNRFFRLFKDLYAKANKVIEVQLQTPTLLEDVVYSINGNLDYYDEIKQLNNIVGTIVEGTILVISNG